MPCEIELFVSANRKTLCPHPAITSCSDCRIGLCSSHIVECDVCELFLCPDCIVQHKYQHELAEQKLRARA